MIRKYFLLFLSVIAVASCRKDGSGNTYVVSASKMIALTRDNWNNAESQLRHKKGYQYTKSPENISTVIKAEVSLPAVDNSNRNVKGSILLNIAPDNIVNYAAFNTDPVSRPAAYALMLNYDQETLQTVTGISSSLGEITENNMGGNTASSVILSKLNSGQTADKLAITYTSTQGSFTMAIFRQNDGRYIFSYRGRP